MTTVAHTQRAIASPEYRAATQPLVGSKADGGQNQTGLGFGEGFVRDQVHAPIQQMLQPLTVRISVPTITLGRPRTAIISITPAPFPHSPFLCEAAFARNGN
jgi:hypothetical protein